MNKIILALGSNIGDRQKNIQDAISLLSEKISDINIAKIYNSKAVGFENQADFLNTALSGQTSLEPEKLLQFTQDVEKRVGRIFRFHWGPREIDIDIIFYEDKIIETSYLQIPHPRMQERDFVLFPILDIAPDFVHPATGQTVKQLYEALNKSQLSITE